MPADSTTTALPAAPGTPIPVPGTFNLRDLGGYETSEGRPTRTGLLFRADSLAHLSEDGVRILETLGLRLVCDLRRPEELTEFPNRLPDGVRYDHNPMTLDVNIMTNMRSADYDWSAFRLEMLFTQMLDSSGETFRRVFEHLADAGSYPFLFHCAAGKDRTGVTAALLLRVVGVPDTTIIADFALSAEHIRPRVPQFLERMRERGTNPAMAAHLLGAPAEAMQATLAHLDERYGSTRSYLEQIGVPDAYIDAFVATFVA